jgi:hypothetical protein
MVQEKEEPLGKDDNPVHIETLPSVQPVEPTRNTDLYWTEIGMSPEESIKIDREIRKKHRR